jgi:hypothetical protein
MADHKNSIASLVPGTVFHAAAPNGASLICLVLSVNDTTITARRVTTQEHIEFDRHTGEAEVGDKRIPCVIDSVAPLPADIHNTFLEMDRKYRELMAMDEESRFADLERLKLTAAEHDALLFVASHYPSNPLP